MASDGDQTGTVACERGKLSVDPEPAVVLWCIVQGVATTRQLPEVTMFSEMECHGHLWTLDRHGFVQIVKAEQWQQQYDCTTVYRKHKWARMTAKGWAAAEWMDLVGWPSDAVLDEYVIGEPTDLPV